MRKKLANGVYRQSNDTDYIRNFLQAAADLSKLNCAVGFPASLRNNSAAKYPDGTSVVDVAIWNNYGTKTIPERRFMDDSKRKIPGQTKKLRENLFRKLMQSNGQFTAEQVLEILGAKSVSVIKKVITEFDTPPNSDITVNGGWITTKSGKRIYIKGKGVNNPLVDTGLMRAAVTYEIRKDV